MGLAALIVLNNIPSAEHSIILCLVLSIPHGIIQQPKFAHCDPSTFIATNMCSPLRQRDPSSLYQVVTDISPQTPGFNPRVGHVVFLVHRAALGQVSLRTLYFFVSISHQYSTIIYVQFPSTT